MEFEHQVESASFSYMDSDYLRYPSPGPSFEPTPMDIPPSPTFSALNPIGLAHNLNEVYYNAPPSPPEASSGNSTSSVAFGSPTAQYAPLDGGLAQPPLGTSYTLAPADVSSRRGRGSHSPPTVGAYSPSAVPRALAPATTATGGRRFNPLATARPQRRKAAPRRSEDSEDEDDDFAPSAGGMVSGSDGRRETIRRQRIESEQRRRDELRDGYARLKETLPATNQKSSKVSLLDRATNHVRNLEMIKGQLEKRLEEAESQVKHLRHLNEVLSVRAVTHPRGIATY